ncbi:MAG: Transcriptional regulator of nonfermentable carbon utilization [Cirrosporium novae-zelandiae]|nr:MAG: Transcriptional regulator of nonfermentable carbon utilization [Cirrosporium novae-zelandiae]
MTVDTDDASRSHSPSPDDSADAEAGDMGENPNQGEGKSENNTESSEQNGQSKNMPSAKDPLRPRRKKARRACFACQRAHLTCGDERPCQRCIKRGLQDGCHDGVRKKAKYLHDAPNEALMPGVGGHYFPHANQHHNNGNAQPPPHAGMGNPQQLPFAPQQQTAAPNYPVYPNRMQAHMPPPMVPEAMIHQNSFTPHPSPATPSFNMGSGPGTTPTHTMPTTMAQSANPNPANLQNPVTGAMFDPSDPAIFNFDLQSLNFANNYGALEFGMLGHITTGAADTPPSDNTTRGGSFSAVQSGYEGSPSTQNYPYPQDGVVGDWQNGQTTNPGSMNNMYHPSHNMIQPNAYTIETGNQFMSPSSTDSPQAVVTGYDENGNPIASSTQSNQQFQDHTNQTAQPQATISTPQLKAQQPPQPRKRPRDASLVYESVKKPYPYTVGFHALIALVQRRFPPSSTLRIAKALASIRPSFISCTKKLSDADLVFMEQYCQRTLWEYEDFTNAYGTPTIVFRRTGEVALVNKEFSILTGWKKDVCLGKEPNLNVNTGGSSNQGSTVSSRGGFNTPLQADGGEPGPRPVFLAELLDQESVLEFYDDFSRIAFGDSRGSIKSRCKLLKYRTREDIPATTSPENQRNQPDQVIEKTDGSGDTGDMRKKKRSYSHIVGKGIAGEAGMDRLGGPDGKIECSYCWMVKRDCFDIPNLIIMNFLPII